MGADGLEFRVFHHPVVESAEPCFGRMRAAVHRFRPIAKSGYPKEKAARTRRIFHKFTDLHGSTRIRPRRRSSRAILRRVAASAAILVTWRYRPRQWTSSAPRPRRAAAVRPGPGGETPACFAVRIRGQSPRAADL